MDPKRKPDDCADGHRRQEMKPQNALDVLPLKLPLPGNYARENRWDRCERCDDQVEVGHFCKIVTLFPVCDQVKYDGYDKQTNWKVN